MTEPDAVPVVPQTPEPQTPEPAVEARLRDFLAAHGGTQGASADVAYLGRPGARVVLVSATGAFTDAVVPTVAVGELLCERLGVPVEGWTRDVVTRIDLSAAERRAMAGR